MLQFQMNLSTSFEASLPAKEIRMAHCLAVIRWNRHLYLCLEYGSNNQGFLNLSSEIIREVTDASGCIVEKGR